MCTDLHQVFEYSLMLSLQNSPERRTLLLGLGPSTLSVLPFPFSPPLVSCVPTCFSGIYQDVVCCRDVFASESLPRTLVFHHVRSHFSHSYCNICGVLLFIPKKTLMLILEPYDRTCTYRWGSGLPRHIETHYVSCSLLGMWSSNFCYRMPLEAVSCRSELGPAVFGGILAFHYPRRHNFHSVHQW